MEALAHKWIIYDGNCGLCLNSKKMLTRLRIIPEDKCLNYHLLDQKLADKIDEDHFRYEMALVDDREDSTLYGLEGILHIFAAKAGFLKAVKPGSALFGLLNFLYHTISYNRYFLFPRKSRFACDCDPPFVQKYFVRWIVLGLLIATGISALFGAAMSAVFDQPVDVMVWQMLLIVGGGWGLQMLLAKLVMTQEQQRDYYRHLVLTMVIGVLILMPVIVLFWLPVQVLSIMALISVLASSSIMSLMHFRRIRHMGLSQGWTLSWFLCLQACAIYFTIHFNLFAL